jgi:hypothetical protein
MSPYLQEVAIMLHHQEALRALVAEKQAIAAWRWQRTYRTVPPWHRTLFRWRLRRLARHARLRKRRYATPWLADLHRIVDEQRLHDD